MVGLLKRVVKFTTDSVERVCDAVVTLTVPAARFKRGLLWRYISSLSRLSSLFYP